MGMLRDIYDKFASYTWGEKDAELSREAILTKMRKEHGKREDGEKLDPGSWADDLKLFGFPDGFEDRRRAAALYGIMDYTGSPEQNQELHAAFLDDMLGPDGATTLRPGRGRAQHPATKHEEEQRRSGAR